MSEDITKKIDIAFSFHQKGDCDVAKKMYLEILEFQPENANVLNLLGLLYLKQNDVNTAIDYFKKAVSISEDAYFLTNLGNAYLEAGEIKLAIQYLVKSVNISPDENTFFILASAFKKDNDFEQALMAYDFALQIKPDFYEVLFNVGNIYKSQKNFEKSLEYALKAFELNKKDVDLLKNIAEVYSNLKNYDKAIEFYNLAYDINPYDANVGYNLGILYQRNANYAKSVEILEKILLFDKNADIFITLANSYSSMEKHQKTIEVLENALKYNPQSDIIYVNLATYLKEEQPQKSKEYIEKALSCNPENLDAVNALGLANFNENNYEKAEELYAKVLDKEPNHIKTLQNSGILYKYLHDNEKSKDFFRKILDIAPDNIDAHISLGMMLLSENNFDEGYPHYMWRHLNKKHFLPPEFTDEKEYKNQNLENKIIMVDADGAHGDTIHFCRYLPFLAQRCKKVIFRTHKNLIDLIKMNFSCADVITKEDFVPEFDYYMHVMDLPYHLNMNFENIPLSDGYLKANNHLVEEFSQKSYFQTDKKKIALFWQGNFRGMKNRAIPLSYLYPLRSIENAKFYSLQKGYGEEQIRYIPDDFDIVNLTNEIKTFSDTAAIIQNVDYVITIDSVIVHLAGALGKKTVLMLPYTPEWRWFDNSTSTNWYKSVQIIKQTSNNNWHDLVENLIKITPNL